MIQILSMHAYIGAFKILLINNLATSSSSSNFDFVVPYPTSEFVKLPFINNDMRGRQVGGQTYKG